MLLYSTAETKNCTDQSLRALCENKENCRHTVLQALGSDECTSLSKNLCCDVCRPVCPYIELAFSFVSMPLGAKKRQPRLHPTSADVLHYLEFKLVSERDANIENNGALRMLPKSVICPIGVIKDQLSV